MKNFEEDYSEHNIYDEILYSSDPLNIITVSHLRHYVNIYGLNDNVIKYFNTNNKTLISIINGCHGNLIVRELCTNIEYLNEQISSRS